MGYHGADKRSDSDHMWIQLLDKQHIFCEMLGSLVRRADHKSGSGLIADFLQIIQTALPVGGGQCRWMQFAIVDGIICFVPQKITIRPSIKKCLITSRSFSPMESVIAQSGKSV